MSGTFDRVLRANLYYVQARTRSEYGDGCITNLSLVNLVFYRICFSPAINLMDVPQGGKSRFSPGRVNRGLME
jgi:hypothetical protein